MFLIATYPMKIDVLFLEESEKEYFDSFTDVESIIMYYVVHYCLYNKRYSDLVDDREREEIHLFWTAKLQKMNHAKQNRRYSL